MHETKTGIKGVLTTRKIEVEADRGRLTARNGGRLPSCEVRRRCMSTTRIQREEKWYRELSYRMKTTGGESISTEADRTGEPELGVLELGFWELESSI
jgi:hypothetical protein